MIRSTFQVLDRISAKTEQKIWEQGILSWDSFLSVSSVKGISDKAKSYHDRKIREATNHLYSFDSMYFKDILPTTESWRLFRFFQDDAIFLDIETSGVESHDDITMIGLFDGIDTKTMIRGINLDFHALRRALSNYKLIITFNGSSFDIPFMEKRYKGVLPQVPNIDLRHLCDRVGLTGGLKEVEKTLGIKRSRIVERIYSGDPYRLWRMFRVTGDDYYLKLLVEYNEDDAIHLKPIAEKVIGTLEDEWVGRYFAKMVTRSPGTKKGRLTSVLQRIQ